ncbi:uncharacterized protein METZ01_LOCUS459120, partial [marine metagenome]
VNNLFGFVQLRNFEQDLITEKGIGQICKSGNQALCFLEFHRNSFGNSWIFHCNTIQYVSDFHGFFVVGDK